jgi:3-hydroxybutyryl-CoA dehydrogenase
MNVVIAGELPLADDLLRLCVEAGHSTALYLVESLKDTLTAQKLREEAAAANLALECHNESKDGKRNVIELMSGAPVLFVSALACATTEAASWTNHPETVAGWGALPPFRREATVEIAAGLRTSAEVMAQAEAFWNSLGVQPVRVADGPGLVRARIVCALVNEAATALAEGVASPADIDIAMKLGMNYPRGPLEWGDHIGLDIVLGVMQGLYEEFGEDRYRPSPLLRRYVQAGWLGQKTGHGFFDYSA